MKYLMNLDWPIVRLNCDGATALVSTTDCSPEMTRLLELSLINLGYGTQISTVGEMLDENRVFVEFLMTTVNGEYCGVAKFMMPGGISQRTRPEDTTGQLGEKIANELFMIDRDSFLHWMVNAVNGTDKIVSPEEIEKLLSFLRNR